MSLNNKRKLFKKQCGFTFIEVLTVVIIVAILVGASIPAYLYTVADARQRKKDVAIQRVMEAKTKFYNAERTAAAMVTSPTTADIAPYLILDPTESGGIGGTATTNSFISSHPHCIFPDVYPDNETWVLRPMPRNQPPDFFQE